MNKLEYLKLTFSKRAYQRKTFLLSIFSIVESTKDNLEILNDAPYSLYRGDDGFYFFNQGVKTPVEGDMSGPLFYKDEPLKIDSTWYHGIEGTIETTVGGYLLNKVVLWESLADAAPYHNDLLDDNVVKKYISNVMTTPDENGEVPEGKRTPEQCLKLTRQANFLLGMNNVFCKASSLEVLTVDPRVLKLRDKLIAEHKDEINNPLIAAKIIDEVVAFDTELMLNGPSKDFFINKAFLDNARKKMFLVFGVERDWNTGDYKFLTKPLAEGWDLDNITTYINTAIAGSFDRGKATGYGGARVKEVIRLTSRILIDPKDCGTRLTEKVLITKDTLSDWIGGYYYDKDGIMQRFEGERSFVGKIVNMRVPQKCQTPDNNYCLYCCGESLGSVPTQASSECQDIPTNFMLLSMKGMHVSGNVKTKKLTLADMFPVIA